MAILVDLVNLFILVILANLVDLAILVNELKVSVDPYALLMAIWGHFGLFQSPPEAIPDGFKGSNTSTYVDVRSR